MQFDILGLGVNSLSKFLGVADNNLFLKLLTHTRLVEINKNGATRLNMSSNDGKSWISMINNNGMSIKICTGQIHNETRMKYLIIGDKRKRETTHD